VIKIVDFSKYSSVKIGDKIPLKIFNSVDELDSNYYIIGGANNLLVSPDCKTELALLSNRFNYIKIVDNCLIIGAKTPSGRVLSFTKRANIGGFEFLAKLPGTIGGIIAMNGGVKEYEIFNNLISISTNKGIFSKKEINFGYRYANIQGIIYEAKFQIHSGFNQILLNQLLNLRKNQPKEPSFGSCFKNPKDNFAGKLIEKVKLKGYKIGNVGFSNIHANFLVNFGGGTFDDTIKLIDKAKERVFTEFGIKLQEEVKIIL